MIEKSVARRWSSALFAIAEEQNKVGSWQDQLALLSDCIEEDPQLKEILYGKILTAQAKKDVMTTLFSNKVDELLLNFVSLLIDKGRETYLAAIKESFDELVNEKAGVVLAKVTAAQELTAEEKDALAASLAEFTKQNVNLAVNVDKEIIGGLKVQIGDIVYDGSVVQRLKSIRQHLSN